MQKIEIKSLGPVKELKMEIKDFNLLIGEQATGKSTVAKAVYFFRTIKAVVTDYLCQLSDYALYNGNDVGDEFGKALKRELESTFVSLFGYSWELDPHLYLKYEYADGIWIDVKLNDKKTQDIDVRYSYKLSQEIKKLAQEAFYLYNQKLDTYNSLAYASKERSRNHDNFKNSINRIFDDYKETYYIPAGRSMITLLANNRSLMENENLDLITREFVRIIDNIRVAFTDGIRNAHKRYPNGERKFDVGSLSEMLISDLKGDYRYNAGKEYIVLQGMDSRNERIPINFASSGQQEILWLLNQLYILMLKKESAFVIIEEPEAHLYPTLQNKVVEFIACFANINQSAVMLTTHSPYILTTVNALYCAGKIVRDFPDLRKQVHDIVGNGCEILPQKVTALKLNRDTGAQELVDMEYEEIHTEMIDEISDKVNETYTDLFYLLSERGTIDE